MRNFFIFGFKVILLLIILLFILISSKVLLISERSLNGIAKIYFDEKYYVHNYPDVKKSGELPYKHYIHHGWKEGKNPSPDFNTTFYKNHYLLNDKRGLNPLADFVNSKFYFEKRVTKLDIKKVRKLTKPKYYLSLVAMFQNEARFLKEWIEFYRLLGVERFYLYNNLSTDGFREVLEPYIKDGLVVLRHVNGRAKGPGDLDRMLTGSYNEVVKELKDTSEWLIVGDTDEFLFPVQANNLPEVLKDYDDYAALSVNWVIFQDSNVERIKKGQLMIEEILKFVSNKDLHVKTIVKPRYVKSVVSTHFPDLIEGYTQVNENKEPFCGPFLPEASHKVLKINHYYQRDLEFYKNQKLRRGHVSKGNFDNERHVEEMVQKSIDQSNNIPPENVDHAILKFVPELKRRMFGD